MAAAGLAVASSGALRNAATSRGDAVVFVMLPLHTSSAMLRERIDRSNPASFGLAGVSLSAQVPGANAPRLEAPKYDWHALAELRSTAHRGVEASLVCRRAS